MCGCLRAEGESNVCSFYFVRLERRKRIRKQNSFCGNKGVAVCVVLYFPLLLRKLHKVDSEVLRDGASGGVRASSPRRHSRSLISSYYFPIADFVRNMSFRSRSEKLNKCLWSRQLGTMLVNFQFWFYYFILFNCLNRLKLLSIQLKSTECPNFLNNFFIFEEIKVKKRMIYQFRSEFQKFYKKSIGANRIPFHPLQKKVTQRKMLTRKSENHSYHLYNDVISLSKWDHFSNDIRKIWFFQENPGHVCVCHS